MSMFKKMKERITDEVSSATNKLQNMQIIDNLAMTIGPPRQLAIGSATNRTQILQASSSSSSIEPSSSQARVFNLIDDGPIEGQNTSDLPSPQDQLFNEQSIPRRNHDVHMSTLAHDQDLDSDFELDTHHETEGRVSDEIDLLNDDTHSKFDHHKLIDKLSKYKERYKYSLDANRKLIDERQCLKKLLTESDCNLNENSELKCQLEDLIDKFHRLQDSQYSSSTWSQEQPSSDSSATPGADKMLARVRELEKLLARCRESLKTKNNKIQELTDSLGEIDVFKDKNEKLNQELERFKKQNDEWTVAIAESKRTMHVELEARNGHINQVKSENNELVKKLVESENQVKFHQARQSELESRIVRMSSAHEKERDTLTKEMKASKANALSKMQEDKEKTYNAMRNELEDKIKNLDKQKEILTDHLTQAKVELEHHKLHDERVRIQLSILAKKQSNFKNDIQQLVMSTRNSYNELKDQLSDLSKSIEIDENDTLSRLEIALDKNRQLEVRVSELEAQKESLDKQLEDANKINIDEKQSCIHCEELKSTIRKQSDAAQQSIYELNARISLLSTANEDQEREIGQLKGQQEELKSRFEELRNANQELTKKNESLNRTMQDTQLDMQNQQEQLEIFAKSKDDQEKVRRQISTFTNEIEKLHGLIEEKTGLLNSSKEEQTKLQEHLRELSLRHETDTKIVDSLRGELAENKEKNDKSLDHFRRQQEQLLTKVLHTIDDIESPDSSPKKNAGDCCKERNESPELEDDNLDICQRVDRLIDQLAKLAMRKNSAHHDDTERLDALSSQNNELINESHRLRQELDRLNEERKNEVAIQAKEIVQLREENQILMQDMKILRDELRAVRSRQSEGVLSDSSNDGMMLHENNNIKKEIEAERKSHDHNYQINALQRVIQQYQEENQRLKEISRSVAANNAYDKSALPDPTEYEYLKNIVLQFMMGKQPLVLAKVIGAVLKFSPEQIEYIVRAQESIRSAVIQEKERGN